jgi:hypothetical protein
MSALYPDDTVDVTSTPSLPLIPVPIVINLEKWSHDHVEESFKAKVKPSGDDMWRSLYILPGNLSALILCT